MSCVYEQFYAFVVAGAIVAAVALKNLSERAKDHEGADISEDYKESSK